MSTNFTVKWIFMTKIPLLHILIWNFYLDSQNSKNDISCQKNSFVTIFYDHDKTVLYQIYDCFSWKGSADRSLPPSCHIPPISLNGYSLTKAFPRTAFSSIRPTLSLRLSRLTGLLTPITNSLSFGTLHTMWNSLFDSTSPSVRLMVYGSFNRSPFR